MKWQHCVQRRNIDECSEMKSVWLCFGGLCLTACLEPQRSSIRWRDVASMCSPPLDVRWLSELSKHTPSLINAVSPVQPPLVTLPSSQHFMPLLWCHLPPDLANTLSRCSVYFCSFSFFSNSCPRAWHAEASEHILFSKMKRGSKGEDSCRIFFILVLFKSRSFPARLEHWLSIGMLDMAPKCSSVCPTRNT